MSFPCPSFFVLSGIRDTNTFVFTNKVLLTITVRVLKHETCNHINLKTKRLTE